MPLRSRTLSCLLLLMVSICLPGCGEKQAKVDVNAQIAALDGTSEAKQEALSQLANAGAAAAPAVPKLIPLLKDPDNVVRRLAAYALGEIGPAAKAALPALEEAMGSAERDFATSLANAIRSIKGGKGAAVPNVSN